MGKRVRREKSVCTCISPRPSFLAPHSAFCCYEGDVWTAIAKFLGGRSLVMLALANKWFYRLIMDDSIWRFACLRDLQVPEPKQQVSFKWKQLYASAFDGSHSYTFQQQEKHIDWMRIGAFSMESSEALLTEMLSPCPSMAIVTGKNTEKMKSAGSFLLKNVKPGVWIADLQLVRCPVCDLNTCEGTMQTLDARHIELFLDKEYQGGNWEYQQIGARDVKENMSGASGAIFDMKHLNDASTFAIFNIKSWTGDPDDWQPKAMITLHAVAVNTNLQKNEGGRGRRKHELHVSPNTSYLPGNTAHIFHKRHSNLLAIQSDFKRCLVFDHSDKPGMEGLRIKTATLPARMQQNDIHHYLRWLPDLEDQSWFPAI